MSSNFLELFALKYKIKMQYMKSILRRKFVLVSIKSNIKFHTTYSTKRKKTIFLNFIDEKLICNYIMFNVSETQEICPTT